MLNTTVITATLPHVVTTHLLPGTMILAGAFLIFKVSARKSEQRNRRQRAESEQKQAELEQKLADLQNQYDSFKQAQDDATTRKPEPTRAAYASGATTGKQRIFETLINENIALREAANA